MKHILLFLTCLSLTGCLDLGVRVQLDEKWHGDIEPYLEMLDQMYQMMVSPGAEKMGGVSLDIFHEGRLRGLAENRGGKLRRFEESVEDGIRRLDLHAFFPDTRELVADIGGGQLDLRQEGELWVMSFLDNETMNTFTKMEDELLEQQLNLLMPSLTGLRVQIDFVVPNLVETNLKKVNAQTCRFELDFDRDIAGKSEREALLAFKSLLTPKYVKFKMPSD